MFPKNLNMDKLAKQLLAQAAASLEADAKNYERKAKNARQTVALVKQLGPIFLEFLKPPKPFRPPKMTRAQKAAMKKAMKNMYPGMSIAPGAVVTASPAQPS